MSGSSEGFFSNGVTTTDFNALGTIPVCSDRFTMVLIAGTSVLTIPLSKFVGIGSRLQDFDGDVMGSRLQLTIPIVRLIACSIWQRRAYLMRSLQCPASIM